MPRRFLTAEDVRRATSKELVVDADTLVTPQAREEAHALGIVLRAPSGGTPVDPPPDRGPDAARAVHALPHLPEPSDPETTGTGVVVTAVGRNRRGILAELTTTLNGNGGSVLNVSQRVLDDGLFHLILVVELEAGAPFEQLKQTLECLGGPGDYVVRVMHERVYRFMHRV